MLVNVFLIVLILAAFVLGYKLGQISKWNDDAEGRANEFNRRWENEVPGDEVGPGDNLRSLASLLY